MVSDSRETNTQEQAHTARLITIESKLLSQNGRACQSVSFFQHGISMCFHLFVLSLFFFAARGPTGRRAAGRKGLVCSSLCVAQGVGFTQAIYTTSILFSSFPSFCRLCSLSAPRKMRVALYKVPNVSERVRAMKLLIASTPQRSFPDEWYFNSHFLVLQLSLELAESNGVTSVSVARNIMGLGTDYHSFTVPRVKRNFQKQCIKDLWQSPGLKFDENPE